jgi:hypothetical protein
MKISDTRSWRFQFSLGALLWSVLVIAVNVITWQAFCREVMFKRWEVLDRGELPALIIEYDDCALGENDRPFSEDSQE